MSRGETQLSAALVIKQPDQFALGVMVLAPGGVEFRPHEGARIVVLASAVAEKGVKKSKPPNLMLMVQLTAGATHMFRFDSDELREVGFHI